MADSHTSAPIFQNVTLDSGIDFIHRNGEEAGHLEMLGSLGGGIGLIDYDQDGLLDIFAPGGGYFSSPEPNPSKQVEIHGSANRMFRNEGNFRFKDVTTEVGLPTEGGPFYSHGVTVGDYDNDGWPDMLLTGYGRLALYKNQEGKFIEVTQKAELPYIPVYWHPDTKKGHWSTSAAWCDLNDDGLLDLYVAQYLDWSFHNHPHCPRDGDEPPDICAPQRFGAIPDLLFLNNGDGTFRDVSEDAGLVSENSKGLGVVILDLDDDHRPDIYVANDLVPNHLYWNQGNGKFLEIAARAGAATDHYGRSNAGMGVAAADYNHTGRFSLFVTNFQLETDALYRNIGTSPLGGPLFQHSTGSAGMNSVVMPQVSWGTGFIDYDNNGNEDIFISSGHVARMLPANMSRNQPAKLMRNLGAGQKVGGNEIELQFSTLPTIRFEDISLHAGSYFQQLHMGRGAAFGDLDNDGKRDIVVSRTNDPLVILRNVEASGHHWLGVELVGRPSRDAFGAKLTLETDGRVLTRVIAGGGSYLSAHDLRVVFGLGESTSVGKLTIRWPSGAVDIHEGLEANRYWRIVEGELVEQISVDSPLPSGERG